MSNVMNPDGTHKVIAGYSHAAGLQERDRRIAELEAENAKLREAAQAVVELKGDASYHSPHELVAAIDALAALLEEGGE